MSRAISQNIAWISAFVLSSIAFAGVLGLVFMVAPKQKGAGAHEATESHEGSSSHATRNEHHEDHGAAAGHDSSHDKKSPETPASGHHEAEEEISADSFKKPAGSHAEDKSHKPHH